MIPLIQSLSKYTFGFLCAALLTATYGVKQSEAQTNSWAGYTTIDEAVAFVRIGPQIFAGPEPYFHRPNELVFNQDLRNFSASSTKMSFEAASEVTETALTFKGDFDGEKYVGTVLTEGAFGTFTLHPVVVPPDTDILSSYAGTYEIAKGIYRTVGFEDLAGLVETRAYYSDGNNFVLMYPISETDYVTSMGDHIRFERENGAVTGMTISNGSGHNRAPKVSLSRQMEVRFDSADATIAGTLMIPNTPGPHPAVIIAHSSGGGERHAYWLFASQFV
jgi:hypothetical protein